LTIVKQYLQYEHVFLIWDFCYFPLVFPLDGARICSGITQFFSHVYHSNASL